MRVVVCGSVLGEALVIQPETLLTTMVDRLALPDIELESEEFDQRSRSGASTGGSPSQPSTPA
jgi:hypothetical protein